MPKKKGAKLKKEYWTSSDGIAVIAQRMRSGLTVEELAKELKTTKQTIYTWAKKEPKLFDALHQSKEIADAVVENSLYKLANGFHYEETAANGAVVKKYNPPQVGAIKLWLSNRQPEKWRDTQQVEVSGHLGVSRPLQDVSTEDLQKIIKKLSDDDNDSNNGRGSR